MDIAYSWAGDIMTAGRGFRKSFVKDTMKFLRIFIAF